MEKLDVIFANRYIKAYYQYQTQQPTSKTWEAAFVEADNYWIIVLQHLLLGMNAHINLDLGIAAAQISPKDEIHSLQNDFNMINTILSSLVADVEKDLTEVWPILKWILEKTKSIDTFLIDFSMQKAREGAWKYALELAPLDGKKAEESITIGDEKVAQKAKLITNLGGIPVFLFKIMRLFEVGTVDQKIKDLQN